MDPDWQLVPAALGSSQGGFTGGGQVGYNVQSGNLVFGIEADIQYLGSKNKASQSTIVADDFQVGVVGISNHSSVEWLSTVRGRAGYAIDRTLVYATGGLAFGGVKSSTSISSAVADNDQAAVGLWNGSKSETRVGYAVGAGAEYALSQSISVKAEYLYYNLGTASYNINPVIAAPDDDFLGAVAKRTVDGNIVRVGLNVKL
jgi:outer membrane immunogenic protein